MKMKKYMYALIFTVTALFVSLVYAPIKTEVNLQRGYNAIGGEVFLWILPFAVVIAVDTYIGWRKIEK